MALIKRPFDRLQLVEHALNLATLRAPLRRLCIPRAPARTLSHARAKSEKWINLEQTCTTYKIERLVHILLDEGIDEFL
jgi:hypothetical protein